MFKNILKSIGSVVKSAMCTVVEVIDCVVTSIKSLFVDIPMAVYNAAKNNMDLDSATKKEMGTCGWMFTLYTLYFAAYGVPFSQSVAVSLIITIFYRSALEYYSRVKSLYV